MIGQLHCLHRDSRTPARPRDPPAHHPPRPPWSRLCAWLPLLQGSYLVRITGGLSVGFIVVACRVLSQAVCVMAESLATNNQAYLTPVRRVLIEMKRSVFEFNSIHDLNEVGFKQ